MCIYSNNVDYANIRLTGGFFNPTFFETTFFLSNAPISFVGVFKSNVSLTKWKAEMRDSVDKLPCDVYLDTSLQSSYRSNENESRPKTKFFSLLIYAGYPIV